MPALNNISTRNWEASSKPKLQSLEPYRKLFAKPQGIDKTVEKNAGVSHTVAFIPQVVKKCAWQVEQYVKQELAGLPLEQACYKLWHFVRFHVEWVRDEDGKEQVRSPRRLIWDGKGDCDCMTTYVDTCMHVYGVKGIINRIVAYDGNQNFSHIYSLIPNGKGGHIIIDCCFPQFNQQKKYTKKEDYNMELQFLDGIEDTGQANNGTTISDTDLTGDIMGEIGRLLKRNANKQSSGGGNRGGGGLFKRKTSEQKQAAKENRRQVVKNVGKKSLNVINKVNKVNPATALLRAGILASMKLNLMKVAERIKWGYAPPQLAASKGMDMSKYQRVKNVLAQAEKMFFAAGGKAVNLRKAIMEGKGNQNRELAGQYDYNENTPLHDLLGAVYTDEFVNGMEGVEGLGEPATAASITAAAGAMGALAALLASIGTLFPKKDKKEKKEKKAKKAKRQAPEPTEEGGGESTEPAQETEPEQSAETETPEANEESSETETTPATTEESETPAETNESEAGSEENTEAEKTEETTEGLGGLMGIKAFYQANKNWILPVAGIATGVIGTVLVYELFGSDKKETKSNQAFNGLEGSNKGEEEQSVIALM